MVFTTGGLFKVVIESWPTTKFRSCIYIYISIYMTILLYYIYIYIMPNLTNQGIVQYWPKSALLMKKGDHFNFTT